MIRAIAIGLLIGLAMVIALGLGGCAANRREVPIEVHDIPIPVATKCAITAGPDPVYADDPISLLAAPDIFVRAKLLMAGRKQRMAREIELKAANAGCS